MLILAIWPIYTETTPVVVALASDCAAWSITIIILIIILGSSSTVGLAKEHCTATLRLLRTLTIICHFIARKLPGRVMGWISFVFHIA